MDDGKLRSWGTVKGDSCTNDTAPFFVRFPQEFLYRAHYPLAIGIAILLDRYATVRSVERCLTELHRFDRGFQIFSFGFVFHAVPQ
jgi:hypothetical protein